MFISISDLDCLFDISGRAYVNYVAQIIHEIRVFVGGNVRNNCVFTPISLYWPPITVSITVTGVN